MLKYVWLFVRFVQTVRRILLNARLIRRGRDTGLLSGNTNVSSGRNRIKSPVFIDEPLCREPGRRRSADVIIYIYARDRGGQWVVVGRPHLY